MTYGIRVVERTGYRIGDERGAAPTGAWLAAYDPEAHDGRGMAAFTADPARALTFATPSAAHECWRAVPRCRPTRPDGRPNRPLTAYTVEIARLDEGAA